ncbi:uncharacterized protein LOC116616709 [Nematostella vectensis]|uniref:uncharacterized protein LOC116616709 n=1 Tax=Nematostella vectensis TaxID=45351 RepID=UPI00207770DA|nr:uncharacterized protein LOC116616709 [Nematostella vectensis]
MPKELACDELYPVSVAEDLLKKQPDWSTSDQIEPSTANHDQIASPEPALSLSDQNSNDIQWIKTNIVDAYGFKKHASMDMWISQPNFKGKFGTRQFTTAAEKAKAFFKRNNNWEATKKNPAFRTSRSCTSLLYITAARYLYVTQVLYEQSGKKLAPCERSRDGKTVIPSSGVCYPEPYGTASCTSDYDVGLVGEASGTLTMEFNNFFKKEFGKPSELVFDTNVYAFTLEFAMPFIFSGLPQGFEASVKREESTPEFRAQELVSAYYKVYKYNEGFFDKMVKGATNSFRQQANSLKTNLIKWLKKIDALNKKVSLKGSNIRDRHNGEYQKLVQAMTTAGGYRNPRDKLEKLAEALLYAAEAYHSRGAIRHVVGGTQMKVVDNQKSLSTNDLWASMVENWGDSNKEFAHCGGIPVEECFLKMSKYMWRMLQAMKIVRSRLSPNGRAGLVNFAEPLANPEVLAEMWLHYKKRGKTAIPTYKKHLQQFFRQFGCTNEVFGKPLTAQCVSQMHDQINKYNSRLASEAKDRE